MARRAASEIQEIKETIKQKINDDERVDFISTGSTPINLALSGKTRDGGWARGRIGNVVGDGSSGKSLLMLETAAWTFYNIKKTISKIFLQVNKTIIVYNNVEGVMDFPIDKMYGKKFVDSVEWTRTGTVEAMGRDYTRRVQALKEGEFLLYITDSWDALSSEAGQERFETAAQKDKPIDGTYGTEKAKYASAEFFRNMCNISDGKDATLLIVSQTRSKIGITFGERHYRSGGDALNFYTHQVLWLAEVDKLKKTFHQHEKVYGIRAKGKVKRNKVAKPFREAEFVMLFDFGIDDILSMIDWYYGPEVKKINFDGQDFDRQALIKYIESNNLQDMLMDMVQEEWDTIEAAVVPERKKRFEE